MILSAAFIHFNCDDFYSIHRVLSMLITGRTKTSAQATAAFAASAAAAASSV